MEEVTSPSPSKGVEESYYSNYYQGDSPFSEDATHYFYIIVRISIIGIISMLGAVANIVNIVVFYRQGLMSSSPTVILTGLATSDLLICILGTLSMFYNIVEFIDYSYYGIDVLISDRPLNMMTQITCSVTAFMGLERAISVTFPFKVKALFSPTRSLLIVMLIFLSIFIIHVPDLIEYDLFMYTDQILNDSYLYFVPNHFFPKSVYTVHYMLSPVFLRFSSVFLVVICNAVIFWKVKFSRKFRQEAKSGKADDFTEVVTAAPSSQLQIQESFAENTTKVEKLKRPHSNKDTKLLKMITIVSAVFLVCYIPMVLHYILLFLVFEYHVDYHMEVEHFSYDLITVLQYFNSSINLVIYYVMSARFKEEFRLLCCQKRPQT